ncbi:MAG: glutathione S-transferase [Rhizobiales bacterium NRL2]|nr:MAG: glutathione S-transferase [Rhizobiales bacterium NRL2]
MITIHHLGVSQSDRIVWLMEELGLPYELKWYHRKADRLMPDDYIALHPAATAPVIDDDGRRLTESAVIVEYICHRHAGGRLTVGPAQPNYADYLYWMHFNNNVQGIFFATNALGANPTGEAAERYRGLLNRRREGYYGYLEQRLGEVPYLAGDDFTCADIMVAFNLTSLPIFGGRKIDDLPNAQAYVERITARPAYRKAMEIAGPEATPPG